MTQELFVTWESEKRDISSLRFAEYNPRQASKKEWSNLKDSLTKFNLAAPIVINRDNTVIGGHFRLRVLKEKGITSVDVRVPNRLLSKDEERELNLRLNKNLGEWDFDLLANFNKELLRGVGFSSDELDRIFEIEEDEFDAQAEYDKIKTPETKPGDLYILGEHRLLCGDAEKCSSYERLMGVGKARLIFTDPPYNVNYIAQDRLTPGKGGKLKKAKIDKKKHVRGYGDEGIFNDNKTDEQFFLFCKNVLTNLFIYSGDDVSLYWWFGSKNQVINERVWFTTGWKLSQVLMWLKNGTVFSRGVDYHRCYEPCMFGWKQKQSHYRCKTIHNLRDAFNLDYTDYIEMLDVWYEKRDSSLKYEHPTQKPVRLAERALKKNSEEGDIVVDVFGGSGSTLMACEQAYRRCFTMELDPKYCDVIIKRWERFTGKEAVRDGQA